MKWKKATEFNFLEREIYFGRRTFYNDMLGRDSVVKGSGSVSDGAFWWKGLNEPPVMERRYNELEILDETPDESLPTDEQLQAEAERRYPKEVVIGEPNNDAFTFNQIADIQRACFLQGASQYAGRVRDAEAENAKLTSLLKAAVAPCECDACKNSWSEFVERNNLNTNKPSLNK
jgi:hypothetical protein